MNFKKKRWWFAVDTYVHISLKKERLLLYNSLSGKALEYSWNKKIFNLVKRLKTAGNLQVISLSEKELDDPDISRFVNDVREYYMGDLIDTAYSKGKPVQMTPIIKIQEDVNYLKKQDTRSVGERLMKHLNQIYLYITNECEQNCDICSKAYRQIPCCTIHKNGKGELDISKIEGLLHEISNSSLIYLDILGGNIFNYSKFAELVGIIDHLPARKNYYSHYNNIISGNDKLKYVNPASAMLKILVPAPINEENLKAALRIPANSKLESEFIFLIQDENEFEKAEAVVASLQIDNYDYQPFYNGNNLEFFKENVFITKEEILGSKPGMNDIYAHSEVNTHKFGKLIVSAAGRIYADVNASVLGILGKDSIYNVLYKEAYHGKSWRRVRKNVEPCKRCTYQALCPPLSDYTYALGRNDLCHINIAKMSSRKNYS